LDVNGIRRAVVAAHFVVRCLCSRTSTRVAIQISRTTPWLFSASRSASVACNRSVHRWTGHDPWPFYISKGKRHINNWPNISALDQSPFGGPGRDKYFSGTKGCDGKSLLVVDFVKRGSDFTVVTGIPEVFYQFVFKSQRYRDISATRDHQNQEEPDWSYYQAKDCRQAGRGQGPDQGQPPTLTAGRPEQGSRSRSHV